MNIKKPLLKVKKHHTLKHNKFGNVDAIGKPEAFWAQWFSTEKFYHTNRVSRLPTTQSFLVDFYETKWGWSPVIKKHAHIEFLLESPVYFFDEVRGKSLNKALQSTESTRSILDITPVSAQRNVISCKGVDYLTEHLMTEEIIERIERMGYSSPIQTILMPSWLLVAKEHSEDVSLDAFCEKGIPVKLMAEMAFEGPKQGVGALIHEFGVGAVFELFKLTRQADSDFAQICDFICDYHFYLNLTTIKRIWIQAQYISNNESHSRHAKNLISNILNSNKTEEGIFLSKQLMKTENAELIAEICRFITLQDVSKDELKLTKKSKKLLCKALVEGKQPDYRYYICNALNSFTITQNLILEKICESDFRYKRKVNNTTAILRLAEFKKTRDLSSHLVSDRNRAVAELIAQNGWNGCYIYDFLTAFFWNQKKEKTNRHHLLIAIQALIHSESIHDTLGYKLAQRLEMVDGKTKTLKIVFDRDIRAVIYLSEKLCVSPIELLTLPYSDWLDTLDQIKRTLLSIDSKDIELLERKIYKTLKDHENNCLDFILDKIHTYLSRREARKLKSQDENERFPQYLHLPKDAKLSLTYKSGGQEYIVNVITTAQEQRRVAKKMRVCAGSSNYINKSKKGYIFLHILNNSDLKGEEKYGCLAMLNTEGSIVSIKGFSNSDNISIRQKNIAQKAFTELSRVK